MSYIIIDNWFLITNIFFSYVTFKWVIINSLNDLGHNLISISNIFYRTNKLPLLLFNISLAHSNNNREVFKINKFYNSIVKFKYPIRYIGPPHRHNCQKFGHTCNYCFNNPRCVKCSSNYISDALNQKRNPPSAGSCTVNYKGCQIFKNITSRGKSKTGKIINQPFSIHFRATRVSNQPQHQFYYSIPKPSNASHSQHINNRSTNPNSSTNSNQYSIRFTYPSFHIK